MKRTIQLAAIVAATVVIIYSCNSDNTTSPTTNSPTGVTSLSGQLKFYTFTGKAYFCLVVYDNLHAKHVVDSTVIASGGSFTLSLTAPQSGWLVNPTTDTTCTPKVTYPSGTQLAVGFFEVHDSLGNLVGDVLKTNVDSSGYRAGQFICAYTYSNTAYSYSGTSICTDLNDTDVISVNGAIGWNEIVVLYVDVNSLGMLTKASETNTEPSGAYWYYNGIPHSDKPVQGTGRRNSGNLR